MSSEDDKRQLFIWAQKCLDLKAELRISTGDLTPTNYYEEKERFFSSQNYNPIFTYRKRGTNNIVHRIKELELELKNLRLPEELRQYFLGYLSNLTDILHVKETIGTNKFPYFAQRLFRDTLSDLTIPLNYISVIEPSNIPEKDLLNAQEIAHEFRKVLDTYNLPDVAISIDDFNDHMIRVDTKSLVIGSRIRRKPQNVQRLIVHEVETHILQSYNLAEAKNPLLRLTYLSDSLLFGEGMAVYNEHLTKTITPDAFDTYYYRLKAVQMIGLSFREIFTYLNQYISAEKAYAITARVKRGMHNTSDSGGYPKDASYLLGFHRIQEYLKNGSSLSFLYIGKVPRLTTLLLQHDLLEREPVVLPFFLTKQYNHQYGSYNI